MKIATRLQQSVRGFSTTKLRYRDEFNYPLKDYLGATQRTVEKLNDGIQEIFDNKGVYYNYLMV
jgi:hypothetical protein